MGLKWRRGGQPGCVVGPEMDGSVLLPLLPVMGLILESEKSICFLSNESGKSIKEQLASAQRYMCCMQLQGVKPFLTLR